MRIAITGHTRGIGRALAEVFEQNGHEIVGFSKSQGCDIYKEEDQSKIIAELEHCDVFINNAYMPWAQSNLLKLAYAKWQGTDKIIVNISSKLGLLEKPPEWAKKYAWDKSIQRNWINQHILKASPRIFNVVLGLVDTEMSSNLKGKKVAPSDVAQIVFDLLKYRDVVYVQEIVLDVPNQNWSDIDVENA
jgi:nucleoside-diphosphate-sugar epimerase